MPSLGHHEGCRDENGWNTGRHPDIRALTDGTGWVGCNVKLGGVGSTRVPPPHADLSLVPPVSAPQLHQRIPPPTREQD
jgi:hypothetical protein